MSQLVTHSLKPDAAANPVTDSTSVSSPSSSNNNDSSQPPCAISPSLSDLCYLEFDLGNPAVELICGRMYLSDHPPPMRKEHNDDEELDDEMEEEEESPEDRPPPENKHSTCLVCLFDLPAYLTLNELHDFLLDSASFTDILHVQLIRIAARKSNSDPTYSALLHFRTPASATAFVQSYDGIAFNSLEPERCMAAFVVQVVFDEDSKYRFPTVSPNIAMNAAGSITPLPYLSLGKSHSREAAVSPSLLPLPLPPSATSTPAAAPTPAPINGLVSSTANSTGADSLQLPPTSVSYTPSLSPFDLSSLPSCPVCLESILPSCAASPTPMLTILCNHIFHFQCLSKWIPASNSSSCPVCRYMMHPNVQTSCSTCKATDRLWMCIICGHVGCSRYALGHAQSHFQTTSHNYAIEVTTQRVWDYTADCYVHRLVRNKTDGKLVELSRVGALDDDGRGGEHCTPVKSISAIESAMMNSPASNHGAHGATTSSSHAFSPSAVPLLIPPSSSAYASVKLEEFLLEYNYLLSSQLDQQRRIFQNSLKASEMEMKRRREALEKEADAETARVNELKARLTSATKHQDEQNSKLTSLQTHLTTLTAQSTQLQALHSKLLNDHSSIRSSLQTSSALYENQQESLLNAQGQTIASLEEQIHDLRFFLDTQKKIHKIDTKNTRTKDGLGRGLKAKLATGQASLQFVEVGQQEEEECKGKLLLNYRKRRG